MVDNQKTLYKFIETNKSINWFNISYQYILSENFISEFKDKIDWVNI